MTGYEMESYAKYEEEQHQALEREYERVVKDYNRKGIFISVNFLRSMQFLDKFVYEKLMKREDIPKEVIMWFYKLIK